MSKKSIENYFVLSDTKYLIGLCTLVVGFVLLWLGWCYNYYMFLAGIVVLVVGMALFFLGSIGRVNPDVVDHQRDLGLDDFGREQLEDVYLGRRLSTHIQPVYVVQYAFVGEELKSRRGRDGIWRTSEVTAFRLFFTRTGLLVLSRQLHLLSGTHEDIAAAEYKYPELGHAEILRDEVKLESGKQSLTVSRARLRLTSADGRELLLAQMHDDMDADALAETINRAIQHGEVG